MSTLVLNQLPAELEAALQAEQGRTGRSIEEIAVELLKSALGLKNAPGRSNGLRELAGRWTEEEQRQFNHAVAPFETIDVDLWR